MESKVCIKCGRGMRIETKFNIGDEVWVSLFNDIPVLAKIQSIDIVVRKEKAYIFYHVEDVTDEFNCFREIEQKVFPTKEELLKSL